MQIHKKIRQKLTALLEERIDDVEHFYSGRPLFIDIDQEKSALAVFIDEAQADPIDLCHVRWTASLNIAVYLKTHEGEDELDDIAEQVRAQMADIIENDELAGLIDDIDLADYTYEQDPTNRTWFVANMRFHIQYED